ncbi:hypothetical protein ABK040_016774 [Willaertia magna]
MQFLKSIFPKTVNKEQLCKKISGLPLQQVPFKDSVKLLNNNLNSIPDTVYYNPTLISEPEHLNKIWNELKRLHKELPFTPSSPNLKRSIFNIHSDKLVEKYVQDYFPTLYSYLISLKPFFYKRPRKSPLVQYLSSVEESNLPNVIPNTLQINHYQHIEKSSCPLHVDAKGLGPTIGMLSFGNDATMSFLLDPPPNFTIEQVQQCNDELQVSLPNGSFILLADDMRYKYVHGIRNEIQKKNREDHSERFSVVFWYQE